MTVRQQWDSVGMVGRASNVFGKLISWELVAYCSLKSRKRKSNRAYGSEALAGLGMNLNHRLSSTLSLNLDLPTSVLTQIQAAAWAQSRMEIMCGKAPASRKGT